MRRKTLAALTLCLALPFICGAGAEEGLGLFGKLSRYEGADPRLTTMAAVAGPAGSMTVTDEGVTVVIDQAYYEGDRVYVSYRLTGDVTRVELHEGAPEPTAWGTVYEGETASEKWSNDDPELQKALEWLDGKSRRWTYSVHTAVTDCMALDDESWLSIVAGDEQYRADGSVIGWKECLIPYEQCEDTVTFNLVVSCNRETLFQDGNTLKRKYDRGERIYIPFSLNRYDSFRYLYGSARTEDWEADADLSVGRVDMKGVLCLTSEEQTKGWATRDPETDLILGWNLYQDGQRICAAGEQEVFAARTGKILFELRYPLAEGVNGLTLVPEYEKSGEHPEEAVAMGPAAEE